MEISKGCGCVNENICDCPWNDSSSKKESRQDEDSSEVKNRDYPEFLCLI